MTCAGMFCHRLGISGAWLCFAALSSAATSPQPPTDAGVAEIKKDLETLKSARTTTGQLPVPVPIERVIELKSSGEPTPAVAGGTSLRLSPEKKREQDLAKEREKSRNWLLEGVAAQERARGGDRTGEPTGTTAGQEPSTGVFSGKDSGMPEPTETRTRQAEPPKKGGDDLLAGVTNPLAPFLSSWMRSEDFELLARGQLAAASENTAPAIVPVHDTMASIPPQTGLSSLGGSAASPGTGVNPYLQSVETELAALRMPGQPLFPAPVPPPANLAVDPAEEAVQPPVTRPELTEKLKTRDDARYFKQLKRF